MRSSMKQGGSYIHIVQDSSLALSFSQDPFLNSPFCQNSHLNLFFFPQWSWLTQINRNCPSKLSIWMGFRLHSLFQWGTNTWAVLCLKVLCFVFWLLLLVKHRFCCVFQLHFHWEVKLPNHELQKVLAIDHHSVDQISLAKTTQQICVCLSIVLSSKSIPVPILGSKNPFFFHYWGRAIDASRHLSSNSI